MSEEQPLHPGGPTGEELEDHRYQRVILLDPPPTDENMTVTLPDGTTFRPLQLMVCPLCMGDYLLGKSELLPTKYLGTERVVGVCPTCAGDPPRDYRRKLRVALGRYPWCGEGEEESAVRGVQ
ncbi:hypothetical protein ACFL3H_07860 [Gemmatimonadota bacterium]